MKRFFLTILVVILCSNIGYAQTQAHPSDDSTPTSSTSQSEEITNPSDTDSQDHTDNENTNADFSADDLAVQERMADAAESANKLIKIQNGIGIVGLFLVFLTTIFAGLAWRASKSAVTETVKATKAEFQPYLTYGIIKKPSMIVSSPMGTDKQTQLTIFMREFTISNVGKTPVENLELTGRIQVTKDECVVESKSVKFTGVSKGLMPSDAGYRINATAEIDFPEGRAEFFSMGAVDFYMTVSFTDLFTASEARAYMVHYHHRPMAIDMAVMSIEKTPNT